MAQQIIVVCTWRKRQESEYQVSIGKVSANQRQPEPVPTHGGDS
jgi:hypothetical protein